MHIKFVYEFLRDVEGWEYRRGRGLETWFYCKKGTARDAEVGVDIFRSQEEVGERRGKGVAFGAYIWYRVGVGVGAKVGVCSWG